LISQNDPALSRGRFFARVAWVVLQVALAYYFGQPDVFFYQGF
jgi:hypothetical protein